MNYSVTQGSNIASIIGLGVLILNHFNINISSDEVTQIVGAGIVFVSLVISFVNRFKKGDVTVAGFRK